MRLHRPFFSVIVEEDWERTEREMISNQVIQNSIDELRAITKVDLGVFDVEGMKVAATTEDIDISGELIENFASSPAYSQVVVGRHLLKILVDGEPAYILVAQ